MIEEPTKGFTKARLVEHLAEKFHLSKAVARRILEELETLVAEQVKQTGDFTIPGVGKLVLSHRKARVGRNPRTGEPIQIPAKTVLKFRIAKSLKTAILASKPESATSDPSQEL